MDNSHWAAKETTKATTNFFFNQTHILEPKQKKSVHQLRPTKLHLIQKRRVLLLEGLPDTQTRKAGHPKKLWSTYTAATKLRSFPNYRRRNY